MIRKPIEVIRGCHPAGEDMKMKWWMPHLGEAEYLGGDEIRAKLLTSW
jgi:hypothetical protein